MYSEVRGKTGRKILKIYFSLSVSRVSRAISLLLLYTNTNNADANKESAEDSDTTDDDYAQDSSDNDADNEVQDASSDSNDMVDPRRAIAAGGGAVPNPSYQQHLLGRAEISSR